MCLNSQGRFNLGTSCSATPAWLTSWQRLGWFEAVRGQLVTVQVSSVGGIGVRCPVAGAWGACSDAAGGQGCGVKGVDGGAARGLEADRDAVTDGGGFAIGRFQNKEGRAFSPQIEPLPPRSAMRLWPSGIPGCRAESHDRPPPLR
jgi:hypothetical protein